MLALDVLGANNDEVEADIQRETSPDSSASLAGAGGDLDISFALPTKEVLPEKAEHHTPPSECDSAALAMGASRWFSHWTVCSFKARFLGKADEADPLPILLPATSRFCMLVFSPTLKEHLPPLEDEDCKVPSDCPPRGGWLVIETTPREEAIPFSQTALGVAVFKDPSGGVMGPCTTPPPLI
jgi:hypothetical protein